MKPIRGGTDGAQLSFRGLPCPNLFTGGYNYHGKHEFVTLEGMEQAVAVIMRIAALAAERAR
jgi:tripeptide aminopeptidase